MPEEKNVLVSILIGCGLFGLLCFLVCAGGMVFFVPRMMQQAEEAMEQFQQEMARQQMLESFPDGWRAPLPDAADEDLFPQVVGNFSRLDLDTSPSPPEFGLDDLDGQHATYESALLDIDVYAYRVAEEDVRAAMQSAEDAMNESFEKYSNIDVSRANFDVLTFSVAPPATTGCIWSSEGWLFLILGEDQFAPAMFQTEYLDAIQLPAPDEQPPEVVNESLDVNDTLDTDSQSDQPEASDETGRGDSPPPPPRPESIPAEDATEAGT